MKDVQIGADDEAVAAGRPRLNSYSPSRYRRRQGPVSYLPGVSTFADLAVVVTFKSQTKLHGSRMSRVSYPELPRWRDRNPRSCNRGV